MTTNITLQSKEEVADGTMAFRFAKPDGFEFRAGQYGDFTLIDPPETDDEGNTRAFSIVTAPYEDDLAIASRMRDTAFKRVLRDLPIGSEIAMEAPNGSFTLQKNTAIPAVFIIGGIGVTPVRSMIAQATHDRTDHRILLIHANKTPKDAPFTADFERFAADNPNFTFVPTLDSPPDGWDGETGFVDGDMLKRHVADVAAPIYYLSGPGGMVKAMRTMLVEVGANEDNIRTEEFDGY